MREMKLEVVQRTADEPKFAIPAAARSGATKVLDIGCAAKYVPAHGRLVMKRTAVVASVLLSVLQP